LTPATQSPTTGATRTALHQHPLPLPFLLPPVHGPAATFRATTPADTLRQGHLVLAHEGGYSEVYVPFCGHAVLEEMSAAPMTAADPLADTIAKRQPDARFDAWLAALLAEQTAAAGV
jgi:hypothetical protein